MKNRIAVLGIVTALVVAVGIAVMPKPHTASAQALSAYNKNTNTAVGHIIGVSNASDSTIFDGEVVNLDTTTVASAPGNQRIYVRRYIPAGPARQRVIGLAVGTIMKSSQGGSGQILIYGYHPRARIQLSTMTPFQILKSSLACTGAMVAGDSTAATVGFIIKYNVRGFPFTGAVWFNGATGRVAGGQL